MPAQLGITGGAEMRYVAGRLRKAAARDLSRELRAGQRQALRPLAPALRVSAAAMLPKRGGYAPVMAKAIKVSVSVGLRAGTLTARIYARGKKELRDVVAVNRGVLRHPVFGNRSRWKTTHVKPGFVEKPVADLADRILSDSADAAQRVLESIART